MLPMLNPGDETTEGTAPAVRRSSRELVEPGLSFPFFSPSDPVLLRRWQSQGCVEGMFQSVGNVWCDLRSEFLTASQFVTIDEVTMEISTVEDLGLKSSDRGMENQTEQKFRHKITMEALGIDSSSTPTEWGVTEVLDSNAPGCAVGRDRVDHLRFAKNMSPPAGSDEYSWTGCITRLLKHGQAREALQVYEEMCKDGVSPSSYTYVAVLMACTSFQEGLGKCKANSWAGRCEWA